eukprot:355040-Chlamydomonas_euryale.AAC.18
MTGCARVCVRDRMCAHAWGEPGCGWLPVQLSRCSAQASAVWLLVPCPGRGLSLDRVSCLPQQTARGAPTRRDPTPSTSGRSQARPGRVRPKARPGDAKHARLMSSAMKLTSVQAQPESRPSPHPARPKTHQRPALAAVVDHRGHGRLRRQRRPHLLRGRLKLWIDQHKPQRVRLFKRQLDQLHRRALLAAPGRRREGAAEGGGAGTCTFRRASLEEAGKAHAHFERRGRRGGATGSVWEGRAV